MGKAIQPSGVPSNARQPSESLRLGNRQVAVGTIQVTTT